MTTTDHLAMAKEDLAIAESADAKREAYKRAAEHIVAYKKATGDSNKAVARILQYAPATIDKLVQWHGTGFKADTPFLMDEGATDRAARSHAKKVAREDPAALVAAIAAAPTEVQTQIAEMMASDEVLAAIVAAVAAKAASKFRDSDPKRKAPKNAWTTIGSRFDSARYGAIQSLADLKENGGLDLPEDLAGDLIGSGERVLAAYELLLSYMRGGGVEEIEAFLAEQEA